MLRPEVTICAPATAAGGAIAVIRISGPQSISICEKIFFPLNNDNKISDRKGFTVALGEIRADDTVIDEVLLTIFKAPQSYTGEDSLEISCHASKYIISKILELLIKNGAESAKPGEFTQRAFFNGKMDLLQAEAVADVISSRTRASHSIALSQLRGGFSSEIARLRSELLNFASLIELELDFAEEDVEFADRAKLKFSLTKIRDLADTIASSFALGNAIKSGIPVAIVGNPNSGKSTLLNALLKEERAIVSEIPGTTRDSIEDTIVIDEIEFRFIDTAGLRETTDVIESMGIKKTYEKIEQAAVILFIDEISESCDLINMRIENIRQLISDAGKRLIILINKIDLDTEHRIEEIRNKIKLNEGETILFISAKEKHGLEDLRYKLSEIVGRDRFDDQLMITNIRHYEALRMVSGSLGRVICGLEEKVPEDLIAIDMRQAIHYLGEISGEITSDEILENIFRNFCIGK